MVRIVHTQLFGGGLDIILRGPRGPKASRASCVAVEQDVEKVLDAVDTSMCGHHHWRCRTRSLGTVKVESRSWQALGVHVIDLHHRRRTVARWCVKQRIGLADIVQPCYLLPAMISFNLCPSSLFHYIRVYVPKDRVSTYILPTILYRIGRSSFARSPHVIALSALPPHITATSQPHQPSPSIT